METKAPIRPSPCPRCSTMMFLSQDIYGVYKECLSCGYMRDVEDRRDRRRLASFRATKARVVVPYGGKAGKDRPNLIVEITRGETPRYNVQCPWDGRVMTKSPYIGDRRYIGKILDKAGELKTGGLLCKKDKKPLHKITVVVDGERPAYWE